jgi:hypothetical protein
MRRMLLRRTAIAPPPSGYCWEFNGTNEYINIPYSATLSFGNGVSDVPFSISVWLKPTRSTADGVTGKQNEYIFLLTAPASSIRLQLYTNGSIWIGRSASTTGVDLNVWSLYTATYDGSGTSAGIKLYKNTTQTDNTNVNSGTYVAMSDGSKACTLGTYTTFEYEGRMADMIYWDKELTAGNISDIYNGGEPRDETAESLSGNLISYWRPVESSDGAGGIIDAAGSNDGSYVNMDNATNLIFDYPS